MGCDVHFYVEVKKDGAWQSADRWKNQADAGENAYYDVDYDERFYTSRNYNLFAILADVRNGYGFAGITTGEGFKPIDEPRGVPNDASNEYKAIVKQWDGDGHSHSYFTVAELLAYDWTQKTKFQDGTSYEYKDCVGGFLTETLPQLEKLGRPEDVRIVFFFDN